MRNMSFAMTKEQFLDYSKDITRRFGWWFLKPGDRINAVEKAMGLKKGEKMKILGVIEIISTRKEPLNAMLNHEYGHEELRREGYPFGLKTPLAFIAMLCQHYKCDGNKECNRIEFRRLS